MNVFLTQGFPKLDFFLIHLRFYIYITFVNICNISVQKSCNLIYIYFFINGKRTNSLGQSVTSSQLHTRRNSNQPHLLIKLPSSPSVPSKLLLSSHPTTCPLEPIPSHLLKVISPILLIIVIQISSNYCSKKRHLTFLSHIATDLSLSFHS